LLAIGADVASDRQLAGRRRYRARSWLFLVLSGLATGASWLCYFRALKIGNAAQVAPVDKLSVVLVAIFAVFFSASGSRQPIGQGVAMVACGAVLLAMKI
jgi:transporter family protein